MNRKPTTIAVICIASLLSMLPLTMMIASAYAYNSQQNQPADAMWVDPPKVTFDTINGTLGDKFNVTVWLNVTEDVFAYQVAMLYNRSLLVCTRTGYTGGATSNYFAGHTTSAQPAIIDTSFLGNGSVLMTESCLGADNVTGPHAGSLVWAEFQILVVATADTGLLTSTFDINTKSPVYNWVKDPNLLKITTLTPENSTYTFIPEFEYLLIIAVFSGLTLLAIAMNKKIQRIVPK